MKTLENATIITAMITPFNAQKEVDYEKLPKLVNYLLENGTNGLLVAGTTGESPTLSHEEKTKLFQEVVKIVAGRVPIIANIGTNNTKESIENAKEVSKIEGISCVLAVVPYYNKPNQAGLYQHFKAIAEESPLPVMIYNVPGRTSVNLEVSTTLSLSQLPNIIGIKECNGIDAISGLVEQAKKDFLVYTGEDELAFSAKCLGAKGVISVVSHICGEDLSEMYQKIEAKELDAAAKIARSLTPKVAAVFSVPSPAPVKAIYKEWHMDMGDLRLPLIACTEEETQKIMKQINLN